MSNEIVGLINITTGVGVPNADDRYTLITTSQAISAGLDSRLSNVENNYATKASPAAGTYNSVVVNAQGIVTSGGNYVYPLDSNVVHIDGTETITGLKTFSNTVSAAGYYSSLMNGTISNIFNAQQEPTGFENRTDSTLSFDESDRTFRITGNYNIYIKGVKYTKTGETQQITNSIGQHFFYYNSSGVFTYSFGTPWSILASDIMIAMVYWDGTKGILVEERHGITMDQATHYYLHSVNGTQRVSGFGISGITPQGNTDATNSYAVAAGILADEDIIFTTDAQPEGGPYNLAVRTGPNGDWTWGASGTPYHYSGNNIRYNQNTGTTWQLTNLTVSNTYVNYYVIAATAVSGSQSFFIVPGQAIYNSLNTAQGESWESLSKGIFPFVEFNAVYQITYRFNTGYATTGRARTEATPVLLSISRASAAAFGAHNTLGGLQGGTPGEYYHLTSAQYTDYIGNSSVAIISGGLDSRLTTVENNYATKATPSAGTYNNVVVNTQGIVTSGGNISYALDSGVVHIAGIENITGAKAFSSDVGISGTLRVIGATTINGLTTVNNTLYSTKYLLGADLSLIPIANSHSVISTWHGMELVGNKMGSVDYSPVRVSNNNNSVGVSIPSQQTGAVALGIFAKSGQTADLTSWYPSTPDSSTALPTPVATVSTNGSISGNQISLLNLNGTANNIVTHNALGKLTDSGVLITSLATATSPTAGTYNSVVVNTQGVVTSGGNITYIIPSDLSSYTLLSTTATISGNLLNGISTVLGYNITTGRLETKTDAKGTKTFIYDIDGKLINIVGTGEYRSKSFTYSGTQLTGITVT